MKRLVIILLFSSVAALAQVPQVPSRMEFGGIKLIIDDPARREIQESVDALTANPRYFDIHVQRARSYFPIIERIFREENIPEDFKYLVLQESALLADAVSSSDAVGFWQFKDFTALEMGLRVDRSVDERMNIVSSSRAAARYMKKNNERFFDNWIITLMAYQMGPGAAIKAGGEKYKGDRTMQIDRRTYWYIKKFLAHKVAFEGFVSGPAEISFIEVHNGAGKSFDDIARESGATAETVAEYNKWLRKGRIPEDKSYTILLPVKEGEQPVVMREAVASRDTKQEQPTKNIAENKPSGTLSREYDIAKADAFPEYESKKAANSGKISDINGKPAVIARVNDRVATLAGRGGISVNKFLRINDMEPGERVREGAVYYLKNKRSKPRAYYHVAQPGEDLWDISQKYGMKLSKLKQRNRIRGASDKVKENTILWLRYIRPADVPVEFMQPVIREPKREMIASENETKETTQSPVKENTGAAKEKREWNYSPAASENEAGQSDDIEAGQSDDIDKEKKPVSAAENEANAATPHRRIIHRVKSGETLYAISREYNVPVTGILEWNSMKINDPLAIGQELVIKKPVNEEVVKNDNDAPADVKHSPAEEEYYVVKSGDTLYGIARKFSLTIENLKELNNKTDNTIKPGEKLKVVR